MKWELITNIILLASFAVLAAFAILGIYQWWSRKSFKKIDRELRFTIIPLILMAIVYFVFDKIIILNTRPNGSGEASFPSTHVMVVATIFFLTALLLPKYLRSRPPRIFLDLVMFILIILTCIGRILANMHWLSDVLGGIAFALAFAVIYFFLTHHKRRDRRAVA